jgi:hypothetical protein
MSTIVFSFIPISLLGRYRKLKKRRREASGIVQPGPVDWGGSSGSAAIGDRPVPREGRA